MEANFKTKCKTELSAKQHIDDNQKYIQQIRFW